MIISWSDDDESEGDGERDSTKHVAALTGRVFTVAETCDEDVAHDKLVVSNRKTE